MQEDIIQYVWKFRLFDQLDLKTTAGESLKIIKAGDHNKNSGPDFFNSRIRLGNTIWAGNVEIHIYSSDWLKHGHTGDKAYDNIILHVVLNHDQDIHRQNGELIPVLSLDGKIPDSVLNTYNRLKLNNSQIPCNDQINSVPEIVFTSWLDRMMIERLEKRSESISRGLHKNKGNWEETFYQHLARNFGFKVNSVPFEQLSLTLPVNLLSHHRDSLFQIEALLFGQSGLLEDHFGDKYPKDLQNEYGYLKKKLNLVPIEKHLWKFMRMRPVNFPTIRLSQFAALYFRNQGLFSRILEVESLEKVYSLFEVEASGYWNDHFSFDRLTKGKSKKMGKDSVDNLLINTIVPFVFYFGKIHGLETICDRAIHWMEEIRPENNNITRTWEEIGVKVKSAFDSQALIQLKNEYCSEKKCLSCGIGNNILNKKAGKKIENY